MKSLAGLQRRTSIQRRVAGEHKHYLPPGMTGTKPFVPLTDNKSYFCAGHRFQLVTSMVRKFTVNLFLI